MNASTKVFLRIAGIIHFLGGAYAIGMSLFFFAFTGFSLYIIFFYTLPGLLVATQGFFLATLAKDAERLGKIIIGYCLILLILLYAFYKFNTNEELGSISLIIVGAALIISSVSMVYLLSVKPTVKLK